MKGALLIALTIMLISAGAFAVDVIGPVSAQISNGSVISLGSVGPGQTIYITVEPNVSTGGKYGIGGEYNQMFVTSLPQNWTSMPSELYQNPMQAQVTVAPDAQDGNYQIGFTLWDQSGDLGPNLTFFANVTIANDVMNMSVSPSFISVGAGQPARYLITVDNTGSANDIFTVGSTGVRSWDFLRSIYIPANSSRTVTYEVVGDDEADYQVEIWARSSSSDLIYAQTPVSLQVNTNLLSDMRAVNDGVLLFPSTEAPLYFVAGLVSNLFPQQQ
jgi:hypothetical protein